VSVCMFANMHACIYARMHVNVYGVGEYVFTNTDEMCLYLCTCMHTPMHVVSIDFGHVHINHMRIFSVAHVSAW
jgi:hypothetical protein